MYSVVTEKQPTQQIATAIRYMLSMSKHVQWNQTPFINSWSTSPIPIFGRTFNGGYRKQWAVHLDRDKEACLWMPAWSTVSPRPAAWAKTGLIRAQNSRKEGDSGPTFLTTRSLAYVSNGRYLNVQRRTFIQDADVTREESGWRVRHCYGRQPSQTRHESQQPPAVLGQSPPLIRRSGVHPCVFQVSETRPPHHPHPQHLQFWHFDMIIGGISKIESGLVWD